MKNPFFLLLLLAGCANGPHSAPPPNMFDPAYNPNTGQLWGWRGTNDVTWIGSPMVRETYPSTRALPEYQVGYRSDGVVVWRKLPEPRELPFKYK